MTLNSFMPVKLITGAGCVRTSAKELAKLGSVCLIVTGKNSAKVSDALADVTDTLEGNGSMTKCQGTFSASLADDVLRR